MSSLTLEQRGTDRDVVLGHPVAVVAFSAAVVDGFTLWSRISAQASTGGWAGEAQGRAFS